MVAAFGGRPVSNILDFTPCRVELHAVTCVVSTKGSTMKVRTETQVELDAESTHHIDTTPSVLAIHV